MRSVLSIFILAGVFLLLYQKNRAMSAELGPIPSGTFTCAGWAYIVDPDPEGTNIRSAPDRNSPVFDVIPHDSEGTSVAISGSFGDWVLIRSAEGI